MTIRNVSDETFEHEVLRAATPVLVDFGATWCSPCRQLEPLLEKLASERPDVAIVKVDVEDAPLTAAAYGIRGVPTLILFRGGVPAARKLGFQAAASLRTLVDDAGT